MCPLFFIKFLFSTKWKPFKNYEKCFLFDLKSSFCSQDIQIFVFPSSLLFLLVSHYFKGCSNVNLKVYDVINCLNKNLITHFVQYLEKQKRYDIETLSTDRVWHKEHFYQGFTYRAPKTSIRYTKTHASKINSDVYVLQNCYKQS